MSKVSNFWKNANRKINEIINFIEAPTINPSNVPNEALIAILTFDLLIISPDKAPKNGPANNPIGPKKNPITNPIMAPICPPLVPPNFFRPIMGIIKSRIKIDIAIINVPRRKYISKGTNVVKCRKTSPIQLVIGPGIIGKKLPISPTMQNQNLFSNYIPNVLLSY